MRSNQPTPSMCRLCLKPGPLRESHVLPEFLYKPMYDEKHRFMIISPNPDVSIKRPQKGLKEYLLCEKCEQHLGRLEKYIKEVIYDGKHVTHKRLANQLILHGLDYKNVRLYYLSLLWRMSVSKQRMFRDVDLGVRHEEKLRRMILDENPGEPQEYGFYCIALLINGKAFPDFIREPEWIRLQGHRYYRIVIGGLLYLFTTNEKAITKETYGALIQKKGDWIIVIEEVKNINFLNVWFAKQGEAERKRQARQG